MTPRQWFALVLRYLGASSIISAVGHLGTAYDIFKGLYATGVYTTLGSVNHAVLDAGVGLLLLYFADRIAAYFVPARLRPDAGEETREATRSDS
jgi:hypothetical protein